MVPSITAEVLPLVGVLATHGQAVLWKARYGVLVSYKLTDLIVDIIGFPFVPLGEGKGVSIGPLPTPLLCTVPVLYTN